MAMKKSGPQYPGLPYVCRVLHRLIFRNPQMLEPRFWCENISKYGALVLLKFFQNCSKGFRVIPVFHFFEILRNFSFLKLSREPFEIRWCTRGQKSFHSWQENFWCSFFWPAVFNNGGVRENLSFSIMLNYLVTPLRTLILAGEKSYYSWQ